MRDTFVFYKSYYDAMKYMSEQDAYRLFQAICQYIFEGTQPELEGTCQMAFLLMVPTIEAACKRHELSEKGNKARWGKEKAPAAVTQEPAPVTRAKPVDEPPVTHEQTQCIKGDCRPAEGTLCPEEPAATVHPDAPPFKIYGKLGNIFLTEEQYQDIQEKIPHYNQVFDKFAHLKLFYNAPILWDHPAILEFAKTHEFPQGRFIRQRGERCNPDGSCGCHADGRPITQWDRDKNPPYGHTNSG